jgi:RsiW-degrading membrane proteinase PrsW (M82 family)
MIEWILLVFMSFLPPLIYMVWIRNTEKYHRERWKPILLCFLWGASIAIIAAVILEVILGFSLAISIHDSSMIPLLTVIVVAPIAEEFTKPLALRLKSVKKEIDELEDGLIYGAVAGLGFSATENLLYGASFFSKGLIVFFILIIMRSFGGCLLHASATAWTGYGYGKTIMKHTSLLRIMPYFALAIFLHGFYNFLVTFDGLGVLSGLILAFTLVLISIILVRRKISSLDESNH